MPAALRSAVAVVRRPGIVIREEVKRLVRLIDSFTLRQSRLLILFLYNQLRRRDLPSLVAHEAVLLFRRGAHYCGF